LATHTRTHAHTLVHAHTRALCIVLQKTDNGAQSTHHPEENDASGTMPSGEEELIRKTVAQLKELCGQLRLKKTGNKADLRKRLRETLFVRMHRCFACICTTHHVGCWPVRRIGTKTTMALTTKLTIKLMRRIKAS
jgi:hypothetical protein